MIVCFIVLKSPKGEWPITYVENIMSGVFLNRTGYTCYIHLVKGRPGFFLREGVGQFQKRNPCTAKTVEKSAMCNVLSTIQVHAPENCPSPPHPLKNNGPNLSCFDCNCVFATISMFVFIH